MADTGANGGGAPAIPGRARPLSRRPGASARCAPGRSSPEPPAGRLRRRVSGRAFPTKVVIVDHSHGGVRAHQAIQAVPDLPVRLLIDLDASSCDFNIGHPFELSDVLGARILIPQPPGM